MSEREKVLLQILEVDVPAPEIIFEENGDIGLSWDGYVDVSIAPSGTVAYAIYKGGHGADLTEFIKALKEYHTQKLEGAE